MSRVREQLIWKALLAVDEVAERAIETREAMPPPSLALRFALAFLYASGNGERWPYDAFWLAIRTPLPTDTRPPRRPGDTLTALQAIIRNVGLRPSAEVLQWLRTRGPYVAELQVRRAAAELLREDVRELEAAKERERRYHG
ncbi:hypothetical protein GGQ80_001552 [Sphingomonas jinjuensis]|uniref:Uncharacterized protein n=1 Tax=Sphingomonas jinjuensis TaxID=535907 RepID=A0A840FBM8_9SPHN|nr:hypothetical protein [Sphingomonas jinjuensis]MBB4153646.1 hypothetical protein [Sphingomonas jinjuensis]